MWSAGISGDLGMLIQWHDQTADRGSVMQITDTEALRTQLSGAVLTRGDTGYNEARSAWNGEIDRYRR